MKKIIALLLGLCMLAPCTVLGAVPAPTPELRAPEIVAGGYEIDMENVSAVYFEKHKDWEALYNTAWESHKSNIKKATLNLNPEDVYYIDEAFDDRIFQWDTLFMMLFDKYAYHEFPTLNSMDNFYYHQVDSSGDDDGFINRMIYEASGQGYYSDFRSTHATNPPLYAWAEWEQYQVHGDKTRFLKEINGKTILERLDSYFQFIKRNLRVETGLYTSHGQGNGLDNTPNQGEGQSANDLSLQQLQFAHYLVLIANEVGDEAVKTRYEQEAQELYQLIQEKLWSEEAQFFSNIGTNGQHTNIITPTALWALAANAATEEQAEAMLELYALNSEKMFRPNGLATVAYDYKTFKPTGGYWNGAMWSPTSFQYLKGLEEYGYDDLAFQEAVRHVDALARVCENGAYDRYGNYLHTLWENYSSEYDIPGSTENSDTQPSRANFVGWAGAVGIGSIIEHIIGITMSAPSNTVYWNMHLTEGNGIDKLHMAGNTFSLRASPRPTATSGCEIAVTAEKPFTLEVRNGESIQQFEVAAGQNTFHVAGTEDNANTYLNAVTYGLDEANLSPETSEGYVLFGDAANEEVTDGLKNQIRKNDSIYNVNTIGYRNATLAENEALGEKLQQSGLRQYVKSDERDGFMVMAPAGSGLKTLKLVLGVQNAQARLDVALSDASQLPYTTTLLSDEQEKTVVVEIPYRAGLANSNVLVKYTLTDAGTGGSISLKGAFLEEGGTEYPPTPPPIEGLSVTGKNGALVVEAEVEEGSYDSFCLYYGTSSKGLHHKITTDTLPATIDGLDNYTRYYVAVSGVKQGMESAVSEIKSNVPEVKPRNSVERAYADWEAAQDTILNGNTGFDDITGQLNFDIVGSIYGSTFEFSVLPNPFETGVRQDGSVTIPVTPMPNAQNTITVKITCDSETITVTQPAVVKATEAGSIPQVIGTATVTAGEVDLAAEGAKDWVQFNTGNIDDSARKVGGNAIGNISVLNSTAGTASDGMFTFANADPAGSAPRDRVGIVAKALNNGFTFTLPYSENKQVAKVYANVWGGDATVEVSAGGNVLYTGTFGKDGSNGLVGQCFEIAYKLPSPTDTLQVKVYCSRDLGEWGGCSVVLQAVTLKEEDYPDPPTPELPDENFYVAGTNQPANTNLTTEGSKDWKLFNHKEPTAIEHKENGAGIANLALLGAVNRVEDNVLSTAFTYSDGAVVPNGNSRNGIVLDHAGNGVTFEVPYSENRQQLKVYFGAWSAKVELKAERMRGSEVLQTVTKEFDTGNQAGGTPAKFSMFVLDYLLQNPDETVRVTLYNAHAYSTQWSNINLGAIALSEILYVEVEQGIEHGRVAATPTITAQGSKIDVIVMPEEGYQLVEGSLQYTGEGLGAVGIENNTFIMPETSVTVTACFEKEEKVDKTQLQKLVNEVAAFMDTAEKDGYTQASWETLEQTMENALQVLAGQQVTQQDVEQALVQLQNAFAGLEEVAPEVPVESVKIKLGTLTNLKCGKPLQLKVTINPEEATNKALSYRSSNNNVLVVDENGVVTGLKPGTARVTVTAHNGVSHTTTIRITA